MGLDDIGYCMVLGERAGVQSCLQLAPVSVDVPVAGGGVSLLPGTYRAGVTHPTFHVHSLSLGRNDFHCTITQYDPIGLG